MAILNFANSPVSDDKLVKEFGIENDSDNISFPDLNDITKNIIYKPLTQYYFFHLYLKNRFAKTFDQRYAAELKLNSDFLTTDFYRELQHFNEEYWLWLSQMSSNDRGFSPFTLELNNAAIFHAVKGVKLKSSDWKGIRNYERFTVYLNKSLDEDRRGENIEERFMEIFFNATKLLIQEK